MDERVVQLIRIVGVEHGAVGDAGGEIRGIAAARRVIEANADDPAVVVETHVVVDAELVALAGDDHVVVAVERAAWPAGRSCARRARR